MPAFPLADVLAVATVLTAATAVLNQWLGHRTELAMSAQVCAQALAALSVEHTRALAHYEQEIAELRQILTEHGWLHTD